MVLTLLVATTSAQTNDTIKTTNDEGKANGLLMDKLHNYVLQSATVSIYKAEDMKLLIFQLTNNWGRFKFEKLPVGVALRLVASNIGYKSVEKEFIIKNQAVPFAFDTIIMERQTTMLKEVTITETPPPLQMKGDTLEFNAAAFKLDTNAVVGDLLRKLPGVTVWNDGMITVNGKKISKLLVEGKEFFGGDPNIVISNISKEAVKKVQVYEDKNDPNKVNKNTFMNIALDKNKKNGYFGKLGYGMGTNNRKDGSGMINYFSPKSQYTIGGVYNNVNKTANDLSILVSQTSYKGNDLSTSYTSDFRKAGQTKFAAFGASGEYDFEDHANNPMDSNIVRGNYYQRNAVADIKQKTESISTLADNSTLHQNSDYTNHNNINDRGVNARYARKTGNQNLNTNFSVNRVNEENVSAQQNSSFNSVNSNESEGYDLQNKEQEKIMISGGFNWSTRRYSTNNGLKHRSLDMDLWYAFRHLNNNSNIKRSNIFTSTDTSESKNLDRLYQLRETNNWQNVNLRIYGINSLWKREPFILIDIINQLSFQNDKNNNIVSNKLQDKYQIYNPLTNINKEQTWNYQPGINFGKLIINKWDGRYSRQWNFNFLSQLQIFNLTNASGKDFQNITRSYSYFIPSAFIKHINEQSGEFVKTYIFSYNTSVRYQTIQQLVPLVDDINTYNIDRGNLGLNPSYTHNFLLSYTYRNSKEMNDFINEVSLNAKLIKGVITDKEYIDALGRSIHYFVNGDYSKTYSISDHLQKAFKSKENQLQWSGDVNLKYSESPSVVNDISYLYKNRGISASTDITYSYKDIFYTSIGEQYNYSQIKQMNLNNYNISNLQIFFNSTFAISQNIKLHTNIDFNSAKTNYTDKEFFTICNADIAYRFLKGANAELKFSALDLLHQNRDLINYFSDNRLFSQSVNTLQQYFMLSAAYFPRKFGLKKNKTNTSLKP
ncbi:outer membrane beta-barrel protein [Chitinophaga sp. 30R24]|uniref:outer membrane beta-barrel protein n=1 Tax=Chitinophaga sp. 30R24 TaxID=3248838 RepID=UPI003B8F4901